MLQRTFSGLLLIVISILTMCCLLGAVENDGLVLVEGVPDGCCDFLGSWDGILDGNSTLCSGFIVGVLKSFSDGEKVGKTVGKSDLKFERLFELIEVRL